MNQALAGKEICGGIIPLPRVGEQIGFVTRSGTVWKGLLVKVEDGRYYLKDAQAFQDDGRNIYTAIGEELVHIEQDNILKEIFFRSSPNAAPPPTSTQDSITINKRHPYRHFNANPLSNNTSNCNVTASEPIHENIREPVPVKPVQCSVVKLQRRRRARVNIGPAGDSAQCSQSHESQLRVPAAPVVAPVTSNQPIKCDVPPTAAAAAHQSSSSSSYIGQMAGSSNETGPFFDVISSTIVDSYGKKPITLWPNPFHQSANKDAFDHKALQTVTSSNSGYMKPSPMLFGGPAKEPARQMRKPPMRTGDPELDQKRNVGLLPTPYGQQATPYLLSMPIRNKTSPALTGPRARQATSYPPANAPAPPPQVASRFPWMPWMPCQCPAYYAPHAPLLPSGTGTRPEEVGYCWPWPYYPYPVPVAGFPPHGVPAFAAYAPAATSDHPLQHLPHLQSLPHVAPRHQKLGITGSTHQVDTQRSSDSSKASEQLKLATASNESMPAKSEAEILQSDPSTPSPNTSRDRRSSAQDAPIASTSIELTRDELQAKKEVTEEFYRKIKEAAALKTNEDELSDPSNPTIRSAGSNEHYTTPTKEVDAAEDTFEAVPASTDTTSDF